VFNGFSEAKEQIKTSVVCALAWCQALNLVGAGRSAALHCITFAMAAFYSALKPWRA
jgi:hypothetical protein